MKKTIDSATVDQVVARHERGDDRATIARDIGEKPFVVALILSAKGKTRSKPGVRKRNAAIVKFWLGEGPHPDAKAKPKKAASKKAAPKKPAARKPARRKAKAAA